MDEQVVTWIAATAVPVVYLAGRLVWQLFNPVTPPPPLVKVADAKDGAFVRIAGRIVDGGSLTAPITGRTCVCFDAAVSGRRPRSNGDPGPLEQLVRRMRSTPFVIDDGTGKALVDPRGGYVLVVLDHSVVTGGLDRFQVSDPDIVAELPAAIDYLFDEGVLAVGERVVVQGLVAAPSSDGDAYRRMADARIHVTGSPQRPAVVSELPAHLEDATAPRS